MVADVYGGPYHNLFGPTIRPCGHGLNDGPVRDAQGILLYLYRVLSIYKHDLDQPGLLALYRVTVRYSPEYFAFCLVLSLFILQLCT